MSFATLPPELLDAIFEPLPTNTLAALAVTCTSLTASADRHLYRYISLSSHTRNFSAVYTLTTHPKLASLVRSFALNADDSDDNSQDFYIALQVALQSMNALTQLELHMPTNQSWVLEDTSSGSVPKAFPNLQHFATSFTFDFSVVSFLLRTPSLFSLQLSSSLCPSDLAGLELPQEAIPKLTSYTGPASLLRHLSPRPLTTLLLSGDLTIEDVDGISPASRAPSPSAGLDMTGGHGYARASTDVQVLSAITSAPPALMIEALAQACPHLSCLRVMTTCAFWEAPDLMFYTRIAQTLSTLPALATFELSGMHWESRPKSPMLGSVDAGIKEWVSPPVTPRVADVEFQEMQEEREFSLNEAFLDWSY